MISPLHCSLVEKNGEILIEEGTQLYQAYGKLRITEGYHCNYGLNPEYESLLFGDGLRPTAHDLSGEVRRWSYPNTHSLWPHSFSPNGPRFAGRSLRW